MKINPKENEQKIQTLGEIWGEEFNLKLKFIIKESSKRTENLAQDMNRKFTQEQPLNLLKYHTMREIARSKSNMSASGKKKIQSSTKTLGPNSEQQESPYTLSHRLHNHCAE